MNNWTLIYNKAEKPLAHWGLSNLTRNLINQGRDTVRFEHLQQEVGSPLFRPESYLKIKHNGKPWFTGTVTHVPAIASAREEKQVYTVAGPWWYLENIVYQQPWVQRQADKSLNTYYKGRVILGQSKTGEQISIKEQLHNILSYAIQQGAPFRIGKLDLMGTLPFMEVKDLSCAEAIQQILRWAPDAVCWFDYINEKPSIHIVRRSQLPLKPIRFEDNVKHFRIAPRYDLQVPAVVLKYEKSHHADGQSWATTHIDAFPKEATGREIKALVLTLEIQGTNATTIAQQVKTAPMQLENTSWWKRHLPEIASIPDNQLKIKEIERISDLSEELLEGAIAPWMDRQVAHDTIRAKISYETENECVVDREVIIQLVATDALSKTYTHTLQHTREEPIPEGLAEALYHSLNPLQVDGDLTLEAQEVKDSYLGTHLQLQSLYPETNDIQALVQSTQESVDTGQTHIRFGPPKHLGPSDFAQLLRMNRNRETASSAWIRLKGETSTPSALTQPTHARFESTSSGSSQYKRLTFQQSPNRKITIDADKIKHDTSMSIQEEYVCIDGELKKRYVLASGGF